MGRIISGNEKGHRFSPKALKSFNFLMGISHGEDAVFLPSATTPELNGKVSYVAACRHIAVLILDGQANLHAGRSPD